MTLEDLTNSQRATLRDIVDRCAVGSWTAIPSYRKEDCLALDRLGLIDFPPAAMRRVRLRVSLTAAGAALLTPSSAARRILEAALRLADECNAHEPFAGRHLDVWRIAGEAWTALGGDAEDWEAFTFAGAHITEIDLYLTPTEETA